MDNISDTDLRQRLISKGFNPPPVTDTSRSLLFKKLKKLEASQPSVVLNNLPAAANTADQYDGQARRTRQSERKRDSSPEELSDSFTDPPRANPSPPRSMRSARKEASVDRIDSVVNRIKNSTPYSSDTNFHKRGGGDPFEKGSDSDDSLYNSSRANSRHLLRKPIGVRRETEYFTTPSAYRRYDGVNGASSYTSKSGGVHVVGKYGRTSGSKPSLSSLSWKVVTPTLVLAACLLLFLLVGGIYYSKNDRSYGKLSIDVVEQPKCSARTRAGIPCVPDEEMPAAIDYLQLVYRALHQRKLAAICHSAPVNKDGRLSEDEVAELLLLETGRLRHECEKMVRNLKLLVVANPHLHISWSESDGFELEDVALPWSCALRIWCGWLWDYLLYVVLTVALVGSMHILVSWVTTWHKEQAKEKQELIKGILEILQQNAVANPSQSYLPVVHVRDQLISFAERNRKRKMWQEAVRYVEENESRVRKEVQPFEGEEYDVWRWVGGHQLSAPKPKTWQGEAFETSKDTMNTPSTSPTPCLKIRHMFDPKKEDAGEDWGTAVKDAILERCEGVKIVHMSVDETSPEGCVFIKCASTDDAGKAYRKIHGAWFDCKIVTVKFLRLERYHERFPASVGLSTSLIPSNDQKRSLAV